MTKHSSFGAHFVTNKNELVKFIGVSILIEVYKGRSEPVRAMRSETEGRKYISQIMQCVGNHIIEENPGI